MEKILQNILFYLILIDFIFIPLYPKLPLFNINETFVAIRLEDFLIALTLAVWGVFILINKKWKDFFSNLTIFWNNFFIYFFWIVSNSLSCILEIRIIALS